MPRKRPRTTEKGNWLDQTMDQAIHQIKQGKMSKRQAALHYKIPRSTIILAMARGINKKNLGRKPMFNKSQEEELSREIKKLAKRFYGVSRIRIKRCAYDFAKANGLKTVFSDKTKQAGDDWIEGFLRRNPSVSWRKPEATSINRITAFNKLEVSNFYQNLATVYAANTYPASRIFNADETGVSTVQKPGKILAPKGQKQVGFATSWERGKNMTVMCCMSAAGSFIPPMFIFARKRLPIELKKGGPPDSKYTSTEKGWMTEELYMEWLEHFQKHTLSSKDNPVLLLIDNHATHCSLAAYYFCRENGIEVVSIPPHTSHRLQPLDVTFYGGLKSAYNSEADKFMVNNQFTQLRPSDIPTLFAKAYNRVAVPEKGIKGFEVTGIFPYNPTVFSDEDFAAEPSASEDEEPATPSNDCQTPTTPKGLKGNGDDVNRTPSPSATFAEILSSGVRKKQLAASTRKQHSVIFTASPNKEILLAKQAKKDAKKDTKKEVVKKTAKNKTQKDLVARKFLKFDDDDVSSDEISTEKESDSEDENEAPLQLQPISKQPGEYVAVQYFGDVFPGQITTVHEDGVMVKAMTKNGQYWKWPVHDDIIKYCWDDVLGVVNPRKFSRREIFRVPELDRFSLI